MPVGYNFDLFGDYIVTTVPIGTSQTFVPGDFLINSSGAAVIAAAANNNVGSGALFFGRALTPATYPGSAGGTLADDFVQVASPTPDTEFGVYLYSATPASAVWTPGTHLGKSYELRNTGTNGWAANIDADTNDCIRITDVYGDDVRTWPYATTTGTEQFPRVRIKLLAVSKLLYGERAAT